ncbi:MAG: rod shape-determining protein MreD [Bryobacteraceae bacterium]|nr:rod shape-determining protein MreD [Bryobacteraceae bacterium]
MTGYDDHLLRTPSKSRISRHPPAVWILVPLAAILFQVYVPRFVVALSYLELPLLITVYFSLMSRRPVTGAVAGAVIGLLQDSLSHQPVGLFGISKTLVGYFSASVSQRFDVENNLLRFLMSFLLFLFHQVLFWVLTRSLLGEALELQAPQTVVYAFLNAVVAVPFFLILDRLRTDTR